MVDPLTSPVVFSHLLLVQPRVDWHPANFGNGKGFRQKDIFRIGQKTTTNHETIWQFFFIVWLVSAFWNSITSPENNSNGAPESECLKDEISSWDGLFSEVFAARVGECIPTESLRMPAMHWTNFFATPLAWNLGYWPVVTTTCVSDVLFLFRWFLGQTSAMFWKSDKQVLAN